ncbi:hypothetical protein AVEN_237106-1 [Araneus ventricosus]|uniref:Uncharacterized protein n=1 Tax=Araneus ventricosus TaxID=182803 RepID=A0A4Y2Q023_ARAVE|nr:hypothetical protein AVEN_237106-1 [Araneus ventricosus]
MLAITRVYRTSSTLSLQVLAGVPPLNLKAIETYATFLVLRGRQDITVYLESFHCEDCVQMESPYLNPSGRQRRHRLRLERAQRRMPRSSH